jgi:hypothetical protein
VASLTRKAIEDLRRAYGIGDISGCPVCRDVCIAGMPGLFASGAYRGTELLTHEEARSFFYGCPECGEDVRTFPIVLRGLLQPYRPIPDPWPISEWPEPQGPPGKRGNVYDSEEERRAWREPA